MKFYSYDYVLSQISTSNWLLIGLFTMLLLLTGFFSLKAYKNKRDSKYRELVIILVLSVVTLVFISISNYQHHQASDDQFRTSLHFIEVVSKELNVDKSEVYVNTSAATDGAIVKVGNHFYRAISGSDPDTYLLEKMELHNADVTLVEVEK
ncbi:Uncharacterised protein [Streptococcus constellatus]|uniref:DUF3290 domain-containing protein n=1 Tax=Streptococcus constellatus TaxID=76860 RepID=A0A564TCJ0_STRCV|nr:DUF3290 domain-containing protein [Streptococcus constellatus]VUW93958.1 Uncharacterised protein [Streptococcus gordonii]VUX05016.1 Uncharacterised protein [Streptococcus constellatus]